MSGLLNLSVVCIVILILAGCMGESGALQTAGNPSVEKNRAANIEVSAGQVNAFCGACHVTPQASTFPKEAWPREVARGFDLYYESRRDDLPVPPQEAVTRYYQHLAPEKIHVDVPTTTATSKRKLSFRQQSSAKPRIDSPAVSFLKWGNLDTQAAPRLLLTDMRSGELRALEGDAFDRSQRIVSGKSLAHVETCDLNGDGQLELLCADLGSISSGDHRHGAVIWAKYSADKQEWESTLLTSGLGRVADLQPADFDQDGDEDLLVAEFGHFRTGSIFALENIGLQNSAPSFKRHDIDNRHGTIHIPVADLNQDGRLDFAALISQEYETVVAFLSKGAWDFERREIFQAADPTYGSSCIELVDLDKDEDLDVVYANGDTFGSDSLKPYHAVHWLENKGSYPFFDHALTPMVGVQTARATDLDGDGDWDIVAGALMPRHLSRLPDLAKHDSLLWLEQISQGEFVRHSLERGDFVHAALCPADFDGDGDIDLAVGNLQDGAEAIRPWVAMWWNEGAKP